MPPHPIAEAEALAPLLRPFRLGALTLPNRVAMAPMTRRACPGGVPGPANTEYYRRRAAGGFEVEEYTDREAVIALPEIEAELPFVELYDGIRFA